MPASVVKPISRSQRNDAYGADTGPCRGDPCRRAFRPSETFPMPPPRHALDPLRAFKIEPMNGREVFGYARLRWQTGGLPAAKVMGLNPVPLFSLSSAAWYRKRHGAQVIAGEPSGLTQRFAASSRRRSNRRYAERVDRLWRDRAQA